MAYKSIFFSEALKGKNLERPLEKLGFVRDSLLESRPVDVSADIMANNPEIASSVQSGRNRLLIDSYMAYSNDEDIVDVSDWRTERVEDPMVRVFSKTSTLSKKIEKMLEMQMKISLITYVISRGWYDPKTKLCLEELGQLQKKNFNLLSVQYKNTMIENFVEAINNQTSFAQRPKQIPAKVMA